MTAPPPSPRSPGTILRPANLHPILRALIIVIAAGGDWVELTWDDGKPGPNGRTPMVRGLAARGCEVACRVVLGEWVAWARWPHGPVVAP